MHDINKIQVRLYLITKEAVYLPQPQQNKTHLGQLYFRAQLLKEAGWIDSVLRAIQKGTRFVRSGFSSLEHGLEKIITRRSVAQAGASQMAKGAPTAMDAAAKVVKGAPTAMDGAAQVAKSTSTTMQGTETITEASGFTKQLKEFWESLSRGQKAGIIAGGIGIPLTAGAIGFGLGRGSKQ